MKSNKYSAVSAFLGRGKSVPVKVQRGRPADAATPASDAMAAPSEASKTPAARPKRKKAV